MSKITPDKMVAFLHEEMRNMSQSISHARKHGLRIEAIEKEHDMYSAIKYFITTHEDKGKSQEEKKHVPKSLAIKHGDWTIDELAVAMQTCFMSYKLKDGSYGFYFDVEQAKKILRDIVEPYKMKNTQTNIPIK